MVIDAGADRLAPSRTLSVTLTELPCPLAAVTETVQVIVVTPQLEGAIVTPGEPAASIEGGISAALLLVTEKCRFPVPLTVNGYFDELEFAAMVLLGSEVIVGAGNVP